MVVVVVLAVGFWWVGAGGMWPGGCHVWYGMQAVILHPCAGLSSGWHGTT